MRLSAVAFFMILTTFFLSGCDSKQVAQVEDRGGNFYGRDGVLSLAGGMPSSNSYASTVSQQPVNAAPVAPVIARDTMQVARASGTWQWPVDGKVTETYGQKANGVASEGIVIAAAEGTPIHAAQAGEVAFVGKDTKNYGNIVILRHADGAMTSYSHARDIAVKKGDKVAAGGVIGHVGQSGNAKAPQLHFAVRQGSSSVDPLSKLPHQLASN